MRALCFVTLLVTFCGAARPPVSSRDPQVGLGVGDEPMNVEKLSETINESQEILDTIKNILLNVGGENEEVSVSRSRRDLMEILTAIPGVKHLLSNPNVSAIVGAVVNLVKEVLGLLQCCDPVSTLPPSVVESMIQCTREPAHSFFSNVSNKYDMASEAERLLQPPVEGSQVTDLIEEGIMCSTRCTLEKLKMLAPDGLPSSDAMTVAMKQMKLNSQQQTLVKNAAVACREELRSAQNSTSGQLSMSEKCWATNSMLTCMHRIMLENCPANQKQTGATCLIKLTNSFFTDLPGKMKTLKDTSMNTVLGFVNSLISSLSAVAKAT